MSRTILLNFARDRLRPRDNNNCLLKRIYIYEYIIICCHPNSKYRISANSSGKCKSCFTSKYLSGAFFVLRLTHFSPRISVSHDYNFALSFGRYGCSNFTLFPTVSAWKYANFTLKIGRQPNSPCRQYGFWVNKFNVYTEGINESQKPLSTKAHRVFYGNFNLNRFITNK